MKQVLSLTKGAQIRSLTGNDVCGLTVQPLIQTILDQIVATENLEIALTEAVKAHPQVVEEFFEFDPNHPIASFTLKACYLFPQSNPVIGFSFNNARCQGLMPAHGSQLIEDQSVLPEFQKLLYLCGKSQFSYQEICQQVSESAVSLLDQLVKARVVIEKQPSARKIPDSYSGVFRLQHAGLLYRSQTTGILVDPHLHSNYGLSYLKQDFTRGMLEGYVDGILISHSHYDHWHIPTLMQFPPEIPIVVPKVPRDSIACEDMAARLRGLGFQNVIAADWYAEPILIGDIAVHVLPFYGEQPLVPEYDQPKHPDLRNWGNTYLIETPEFSSWFLIDAGADPMGSMAEVAAYVAEKQGGIDQVISNFQPLSYNSIGTDLSSWGVDIVGNLLSNPPIFALTNKKEGFHLATLGPQGVAEISAIVNAKVCLPYAHSWAEPGEQTTYDQQLVPQVEEHLSALGAKTKVIPWRIGDVCSLNQGTFEINQALY